MTSLPPTAGRRMSGGVPFAGAIMLVGRQAGGRRALHLRKYDDCPVAAEREARAWPPPRPPLQHDARRRRRPAVLLVHGWGGEGRERSPHAEALAGHFRVIAPDLPGHGRSEVPDEGNTLARWRTTWPRCSTPSAPPEPSPSTRRNPRPRGRCRRSARHAARTAAVRRAPHRRARYVPASRHTA
ncbi:alpha/beta fold hydrolase [Streptomyces coeruleorubidus]|uniref:alpha/beta fold hydrolase n=1 Tax=Streptomyces coeruleorubidus TaxID=116188 RepID=UPI0036480C82